VLIVEFDDGSRPRRFVANDGLGAGTGLAPQAIARLLDVHDDRVVEQPVEQRGGDRRRRRIPLARSGLDAMEAERK
jgi:hypothetical protein